jgi:hypothetical protein
MGAAIGSQTGQSRLGSNWATITDFGVVPNSTAAAAANRRNIITKAFASGKHLYWPGGTYYVDGPIYGLPQGVNLAGDPAGTPNASSTIAYSGYNYDHLFLIGHPTITPQPDQMVNLGGMLDGSVTNVFMLQGGNYTYVSRNQMYGLRAASPGNPSGPRTTLSCWSDPFSLGRGLDLWGGPQYTVEIAFRSNQMLVTAAAAAGSSTLTLQYAAGLSPGDVLTFTDATREAVTIAPGGVNVATGQVTLTAPLANAHAANSAVMCSGGCAVPNMGGNYVMGLVGLGTVQSGGQHPWAAYFQNGSFLIQVRGNDGNSYNAWVINNFSSFFPPGPGGLYRITFQFDWTAPPLVTKLWINGQYTGSFANGMSAAVTRFAPNEGVGKLNVFNLTLGYADQPAGPNIVIPDFTLAGLRTSTGLRYYNRVKQVNLTNGGSGYTTAPAVTFSAPQRAGGVTATGTATVNAGGQVTGVTITNAGTGYTTTPSVTFAAPTGGGTTATGSVFLQQIRTDNNQIPTDAYAYFGDDAQTQAFLPLTDAPGRAYPLEVTVQWGGNTHLSTTGFWLSTGGNCLGGYYHAFSDLGFQGNVAGQPFGNAVTFMSGVENNFQRCKFYGGAFGWGSGGGIISYQLQFDHCEFGGALGNFLGINQSISASDIRFSDGVTGTGRYAVRLHNSEGRWTNVWGGGAFGRPYNYYMTSDSVNYGCGDHLIDGYRDDSETTSVTVAAFRCDLHVVCPRTSLILRNIKLDHVENSAAVVYLGWGGTANPGYAVLENVACGFGGTFFLVGASSWYGEARASGGCNPNQWLRYTAAGNPNFRTVHDNLGGPPTSGAWVAGGHLIELKSPDASGNTRYYCTSSGSPGTWTGK